MPNKPKKTDPKTPVPKGNRATVGAPFDLLAILEIWNLIKTKDYWSAVKKAIHLIDQLINPAIGGGESKAMTEETQTQFDKCCCDIEDWCSEQDGKITAVAVDVSGTAVEFSTDDAAQVLALLIRLLAGWRNW